MAEDHPRTAAAQNRSLHAAPSTPPQLLPSLDPGVTLLDIRGGRGVPVVQSLVLDHLLTTGGPVVWLDATGIATTTTMAQLAPSRRSLEQIHVARGFTATQHHALATALPPVEPTLIVAPAVDAMYRDTDAFGPQTARRLLARTLAALIGHDAPAVLLTRTATDRFAAPVATCAHHHLTCELTAMGPRFTGDTTTTLVYPTPHAGVYQTTLAYWQQLLDARARAVGADRTTPAHHTPPAPAPDPMADALTAAGW